MAGDVRRQAHHTKNRAERIQSFCPVLNIIRLFSLCSPILQQRHLIFLQNGILDHFSGAGIDGMSAISRYSPSAERRLGIAINSPFSPSITLISWITNSLSMVIDTIAFILPSFSTRLTLTSVTCILIPFRPLRQPPCCIFHAQQEDDCA